MVFAFSSNFIFVNSLSLKIFILNELSFGLLLENEQWVKLWRNLMSAIKYTHLSSNFVKTRSESSSFKWFVVVFELS